MKQSERKISGGKSSLQVSLICRRNSLVYTNHPVGFCIGWGGGGMGAGSDGAVINRENNANVQPPKTRVTIFTNYYNTLRFTCTTYWMGMK